MHIAIDESGQFIPLDSARSRAAAVAAVVIPSSKRKAFGRAFRDVKRHLGYRNAEVKGSRISEDDAHAFLAVMRRYDVIAEAIVIDVGLHNSDDVTNFKNAQAARLLHHITRDHQPTLIQQLLDYEDRLKQLSNQLFLQAFCLWQLVPQVLETATMFFSQRIPAELGSFVWRVDAKGSSVTELETIWTTLIGPIITTHSETAPMGMIPSGDYSFYSRYDVPPPPELAEYAASGRFFTDMKSILRDDFKFVPSEQDLGVQAADVVVSVLTRALNGAMDKSGWRHLAPLFVTRNPQPLRFVALETSASVRTLSITDPRWIDVSQTIKESSRPMLTARSAQLLRESGA